MGRDPYLGEIKGFDPEKKCILCGKPVYALSYGGPDICPWCDTGHPENRPERIEEEKGSD
jgi:hypothetical protein